jgi:hypothetical protein
MPYWFLPIVTLALAAVPWFRFRFNLRTLLIVIAMVSLFLGGIKIGFERGFKRGHQKALNERVDVREVPNGPQRNGAHAQ